jgi:uncharacterized surface anchored protein
VNALINHKDVVRNQATRDKRTLLNKNNIFKESPQSVSDNFRAQLVNYIAKRNWLEIFKILRVLDFGNKHYNTTIDPCWQLSPIQKI